MGGPLLRDKLWFYESVRMHGVKRFGVDAFFNKEMDNPRPPPGIAFNFTPDLSRPAFVDVPVWDIWNRVTWQATGKQKLGFLLSIEHNNEEFEGATDGTESPEATSNAFHWPNLIVQATWSYPMTNRLLFEAGNSTLYEESYSHPDGVSSPDPRAQGIDIPVSDEGINFDWGAATCYTSTHCQRSTPGKLHNSHQRFSVSYVTGSHASKFGLSLTEAWMANGSDLNHIPGPLGQERVAGAIGPVRYIYDDGVPEEITQYAVPMRRRWRMQPALGLFAQDRWTMQDLTLNLGLRYDFNNQYAQAQVLPAIPEFAILERSFPQVNNVPRWHDISPRFGAAYDLFGDGQTAIKGSFGRYVLAVGTGIAQQNTPSNRLGDRTDRSWTDANGDFRPDCDFTNSLANGECGALKDQNFGSPKVSLTYDPSYMEGWFNRPYMWQGNIQLQHELGPGLGLNVGYYYVSYGNFPVGVNTDVTPADFDTYCVTTPTDTRVGSFGGQELCGFWNVSEAKFGEVDNHVQLAGDLGADLSQRYNGFDVSVNADWMTAPR